MLATKIRNLSKRDQLELVNCSLVDQEKRMTLRISKTTNSKVKFCKYLFKLATHINIAIDTYKEADNALLEYVI